MWRKIAKLKNKNQNKIKQTVHTKLNGNMVISAVFMLILIMDAGGRATVKTVTDGCSSMVLGLPLIFYHIFHLDL